MSKDKLDKCEHCSGLLSSCEDLLFIINELMSGIEVIDYDAVEYLLSVARKEVNMAKQRGVIGVYEQIKTLQPCNTN